MKITVIGNTGFVGRNVIDVLKNAADVSGLSKSTGFDLMTQDISEVHIKILRKSDFIINCAANVGSLNYVTDKAAEVIDSNSRMILNLYQLVHTSGSGAIIINPIANCGFPGTLPIYKEDDFWNGELHHSVLSYGMTRRFLVSVSKCYELQYGITSINYYVPNMYGEYDSNDPNKAHALNALVGKFVTAAHLDQKEVSIWGTGKPIREWLYAKDFGRIVLETALRFKTGEKFPEAINIGQKSGISIMELIDIIKLMVGYKGAVVSDISKQDGAPIKVMDDSQFRKRFPDFKFTPLSEGIERTVAYYKRVLFNL